MSWVTLSITSRRGVSGCAACTGFSGSSATGPGSGATSTWTSATTIELDGGGTGSITTTITSVTGHPVPGVASTWDPAVADGFATLAELVDFCVSELRIDGLFTDFPDHVRRLINNLQK